MTQKKQTIPFLSFRSGDGLGAPEPGTAIFRYNSALNRVEFSLDGGPYQGFANDYGGSLYGELITAPIKNPILEGYLAYVDNTSTELNRVKVESLLDFLAVSTTSLQNAYDVNGEIITSSESGRFAISGTEEIALSSSSNIEILSVGPLVLGAGGHQVSWPAAPGAAGTVLVNNGEGDLSWAAPPGGSVSSVGLSGGTTGLTVSGTNPITSSGTFTLGGTLSIGNGGTGATSKADAFDALSPVEAIGDLITFDGTNNVSFPVGADNQILTADSTHPLGLRWSEPAVTAAAGNNRQIQFNTGGAFDASAKLAYDKLSEALEVTSNVRVFNVGGEFLRINGAGNSLEMYGTTGALGNQLYINFAGLADSPQFLMSASGAQTGLLSGELYYDGVPAFNVRARGGLTAEVLSGQVFLLTPETVQTGFSAFGPLTFDFDTALTPYKQVGPLTGDISFASALNPGAARSITVKIIGDIVSRDVTSFPTEWKWLGGELSVVPANATVIVSLTCFGPAQEDIVASWSYDGALPITSGGTGTTSKIAAFDALSPAEAVGDLITFDGTNNVALPVGSDNQVLTADSSQPLGLRWSDPSVGTVTGSGFGGQLAFFTGEGESTNLSSASGTTFDQLWWSQGFQSLAVRSGSIVSNTIALQVGGRVAIPRGSSSAPSLTFHEDSAINTGIFSPFENQVAISTDGAQRLNVTTAGITVGEGLTNYTLPLTRGTNGQVLQTDGNGFVSWAAAGGGGTVTGSGTATQLAYFTGATAIGSETASGSNALTWDATNNFFGVRTSSPTHVVDVQAGTPTGGAYALNVNGTLNTDAATRAGAYFEFVTNSGSGGRLGTSTYLYGTANANQETVAIAADNRVPGTGSDPLSSTLARYNVGVRSLAGNVNGGVTNVAVAGYANQGSALSVGLLGVAFSSSPASPNRIGVFGMADTLGTVTNIVGGYFTLAAANTPNPTFTTAALIADNGSQAAPIFLARDNGTATFTIADGGDTTISPVSGHTGDALKVTGGNLVTLKNALDISATLANPGSTFEAGAEFQITANGSGNSLQFGVLTQISGTYSGSGQTTALSFRNDLAGTGASLFNDGLGMRPDGNRGIVGHTVSTTSGNNSAVVATAGSGNRNFGGYFSANIDKASALNVGVYGAARNAASGATEIGGMFHLYSSTSFPVFASAALLADNGPSTSPIFVGRDEGSEVFRIADGGNVGIGTASPGSKLTLADGMFTQRSSAANDVVMRSFPSSGSGKNRIFDLYESSDVANSANIAVGIAPTSGWVGASAGAFVFSSKNGTGVTQNLYLCANDGLADTAKGTTVQANTGRIGIGTSSPTATLSVSETFRIDGSTGQIVEYGNAAPTKGNLLVGDGTSLVSVGVGSNGQVLLADSSQTSGVRWGAATGVSSNSAPIQTKTSNYTMTSLDGTILADASSGSITITLPAVASSSDLVFTIKKKDITANTVTVDANASELIDGATTYVLSTQYEAIKIQSDGTAWWII